MRKQGTKDATVNMRLAKDERRKLERAARDAHLSLGTWMRQTCLRAAERETRNEPEKAKGSA